MTSASSNYHSSNFNVFGDLLGNETGNDCKTLDHQKRAASSLDLNPASADKGGQGSKFTRKCCEQKHNWNEADYYITEGWERPKTGKVKPQYANNQYSFRGDRVIVYGKYGGKVMYMGTLNDKLLVSDLYVGVKLDEYNSKIGGTGHYNGKYFFDAPQGFGVFVRYDHISKCKQFDPTVEGGPDKKVLKNQSSLAWLYGQSLDEADVKEHSLMRSKSLGKINKTGQGLGSYKERQQLNLMRDWGEKYGERHSGIMLSTFQKLCISFEEEERRLMEEEKQKRQQEELRRLQRIENGEDDEESENCEQNSNNSSRELEQKWDQQNEQQIELDNEHEIVDDKKDQQSVKESYEQKEQISDNESNYENKQKRNSHDNQSIAQSATSSSRQDQKSQRSEGKYSVSSKSSVRSSASSVKSVPKSPSEKSSISKNDRK